MSSELVRRVKYCIIGAGIHGLSTAYHLALRLKRANRSQADEILVLDKSGVAAGASGIACGVVRNNYFQPAMSDLMISSIDVWEQHAAALQYHPVGYIAVAGPKQSADLVEIAAHHDAAGYPHTLVVGEQACDGYLRRLFPDWKKSDGAVVLHEHKGGFAYSAPAVEGLARMVESLGVPILGGVEVEDFDIDESDESVHTVYTSRGAIEVDQIVVAVGPWINGLWQALRLPSTIDVRDRDGDLHPNRVVWTYWQLQEGEIGLAPDVFSLPDGAIPPVMHIDSEEPLCAENGTSITHGAWGIYFKHHRGNVQGGAVPNELGSEADVDPYGTASPHYTVGDEFVSYWTAGLARSMKRFEGCRAHYKSAPSGGIGCFSVDNFPIFDYLRPNVYVIADSNHGFKMIGVGKEVAEILTGHTSRILEPFRFRRFAEGALHPVSSSPFPWS